ncbi:unnamed protein product [Rhodiola kirilowii]
MEKKTESFPGTRKTNFKRSFKLSVHSLLTSCSKEQFSSAFSGFPLQNKHSSTVYLLRSLLRYMKILRMNSNLFA